MAYTSHGQHVAGTTEYEDAPRVNEDCEGDDCEACQREADRIRRELAERQRQAPTTTQNRSSIHNGDD